MVSDADFPAYVSKLKEAGEWRPSWDRLLQEEVSPLLLLLSYIKYFWSSSGLLTLQYLIGLRATLLTPRKLPKNFDSQTLKTVLTGTRNICVLSASIADWKTVTSL